MFFILWNLSYWCQKGCYYYIAHKQPFILQSFNSGVSDSPKLAVLICHEKRVAAITINIWTLHKPRETYPLTFIQGYKSNYPHSTHKKDYVTCLKAMRMLGWSQECSLVLLVSSASEEDDLEFREASLETLLFLSFSWEWGSALVTGCLKWSISPFFGQKG